MTEITKVEYDAWGRIVKKTTEYHHDNVVFTRTYPIYRYEPYNPWTYQPWKTSTRTY